MSRSDPRPHLWKVQGEIPHQQYLSWLQMRAQANFRKEPFELTFEDFQSLWLGNWELKGRGSNNYCLTRRDPRLAWSKSNTECVRRAEQLGKQNKEKRNGKNSSLDS